MRQHLFQINFRDSEIRRREKDYIGFLSRFRNIEHSETILLGDWDGFAAFVQTDDDFDPAILEVQRMRMSLRSEADDSAHFVLQIQQVRIFF
jgi:hypothetical protein